MNDAVVVEGLSKQYQLGIQSSGMLREALSNLARRPFRRQRREDDVLWAVRDVSFNVGQGEVVGILGRNGAGKSTLLKLLSRITYPTAGSIRTRGRIASLLEVGTGFHEELTGRENIYLNGSILGMRKREIDRHLDAIVDFAGVERFMDTPIKRYSSGMRLRLGFAVAAHLDTQILLVDEVLAVGDIEFQKKCLASMDALRGGGRTVFFVSHNMAAIENLCPRSIWISGGRVHMDGPTRQVVAGYMSTFAKAQHGSGSLAQITDRRGRGSARFTGLEFLDGDGNRLSHVCSGDRVTMRFHFDVHETVPDLTLGLEIRTELGLKLIGTNTDATGLAIPRLSPGSWSVDLEIDTLYLLPGAYHLSLFLGRWGSEQDILENCVVMDVEPSDYYRTGKGIEPNYGLVFMPCRWTSQSMREHALTVA